MGNRIRSGMSLHNSTIGSQTSNTFSASAIVVSDMKCGSGTIDNNLSVGSIISNSLGTILKNRTIINSIEYIDLNELYSFETTTQTSSSSRVGFICVSVIDNINNTGSMGLYTRGKIFDLDIYTIIFEKNSNNDSIINLNTDTGILKIETKSSIVLEIKALNLFEK